MDINDKIRRRYDRISGIYDVFEQPMEMMALKKYRVDLMNELNGKVLEVGVGTGKNFEYYPENMDITAIDFSSKMLSKAKERAVRLNKKVKLLQMDVQQMEFPDNMFDCIFTTCVFCSVLNPVEGLKEIRRVCKPGGRILMIEHVRSERRIIGKIMDFINPFIVRLYGANINRRTILNVKSAGFEYIDVTDLVSDIVKRLRISNIK